MFCGKCGSENEESFQFCKSCGANLAVQAGKVLSEVDGFDLKDEDSADDVHVKLATQEILDRFSLREGEEVLDVACYPLDNLSKQSKKVKKITTALRVSMSACPFLLLFFIILSLIEDNSFFITMLYILFIVTILINVVMQSKVDSLRGEKQILIVTNQRILGRGACTKKALAENKTLINLEIGSYYTQGFSRLFGIEKFTLEYGNNNRVFYGLKDLDRILDKIDEVRNSEH